MAGEIGPKWLALVQQAGGDLANVPNDVTRFNGRRNSGNYQIMQNTLNSHYKEPEPAAGIEQFLEADGSIEVQGVTMSTFNKRKKPKLVPISSLRALLRGVSKSEKSSCPKLVLRRNCELA